jgi:hypothetical protein
MKKLKALFAVAALIYIVAALFQLGPVYINYLGFKDSIQDEARIASYSQRDERAIRNDLDRKITEYSIPNLKAEDMDVHKAGSNVSIACDYTVHVPLPLHPIDLPFHIAFDSSGQIGQLPH